MFINKTSVLLAFSSISKKCNYLEKQLMMKNFVVEERENKIGFIFLFSVGTIL